MYSIRKKSNRKMTSRKIPFKIGRSSKKKNDEELGEGSYWKEKAFDRDDWKTGWFDGTVLVIDYSKKKTIILIEFIKSEFLIKTI